MSQRRQTVDAVKFIKNIYLGVVLQKDHVVSMCPLVSLGNTNFWWENAKFQK